MHMVLRKEKCGNDTFEWIKSGDTNTLINVCRGNVELSIVFLFFSLILSSTCNEKCNRLHLTKISLMLKSSACFSTMYYIINHAGKETENASTLTS